MATRIVFAAGGELLVAQDEAEVIHAIRRDHPNPVTLEGRRQLGSRRLRRADARHAAGRRVARARAARPGKMGWMRRTESAARLRGAGRYAPSPSGPLHLGNLRTALLAWLAARSRRARFVLRVEDIDRERCRPQHERGQLADLAALGLDWDGPVVRQSERLREHREAFERLRAGGRVYPCWCTRADVREAASAPHGASPAPVSSMPADGSVPGAGSSFPSSSSRTAVAGPPTAELSAPRRYPGTCRDLSVEQRRRRARETGRAPVWRLDGRSERVCFDDLLRGRCEGVVDDVVLWRGDDAPAYNLAVVVDDRDQGVGEVLRGDDLLASTPAQILLAELLDIPRPVYLHVPLVLGAQRRRLAKRDGAVTLAQRLARGETVEQLIGWMARSAGLADAGEPTTLDALLSSFDPKRLATEPALLPPVAPAP